MSPYIMIITCIYIYICMIMYVYTLLHIFDMHDLYSIVIENLIRYSTVYIHGFCIVQIIEIGLLNSIVY